MTTTTNKIALITGANKGIGLETARRLGAEGCTVLLGARDAERGRAAEQALRAEGIDAHDVRLDVTDDKAIAAAAERIEAEYGRLDILVNNAAVSGRFQAPSETDAAAIREVFGTNLVGVVLVTNAMLPLLRRAPAARIVNVSSEVGSMAVELDQSLPLWRMAGIPYPASKAALNMVTVMYAKELWDTPIKVNAANPGYCATDLNGHSGFLSAAQGAEASVRLALLDADGPTGGFFGFVWTGEREGDEFGELPW